MQSSDPAQFLPSGELGAVFPLIVDAAGFS